MKRTLVIAVAMAAAMLTSAHAATIITTGYGTGYSVALTGFLGGAGSGTASSTGVVMGTYGYGLSGVSGNDIQATDFIVMDFSTLNTYLGTAKLQSINIGLETYSAQSGVYWDIYGSTTKPAAGAQIPVNGNSTYHLLAYSPIGSSGHPTFDPAVYSAGATGSLGTLYAYYIVAVTSTGPDCGVQITGAQLTVPPSGVPEPATFLMAGVALVGLGAGMKRFQKRS